MKHPKITYTAAAFCFCLSFAGVIKGNHDNAVFSVPVVSDEEFSRRLQMELVAANDLDLFKSLSEYTGPASRHTKDTKALVDGVKRDLIEQGLYEVKP